MNQGRSKVAVGAALVCCGAALAAFYIGCGTAKSVGEEVFAPAGSKWQRAWVEVEWDPGGTRASEFGPAQVDASETRSLLMAGEGRESLIVLAKTAERSGAKETLRFAPDGHGLAISIDGGRSWRYVCLEAGDEPFLCDHVKIEAADPWARAPATRGLCLEILATATGGAAPAGGVSHFEDGLVLTGHEELGSAAIYAVARAAEDEALRLAFARAFFGPQASYPEGGVAAGLSGFVPDAAKLVRSHEDVRAIFEAGLDGAAMTNAAAVLSEVPDRRTADLLAAAVRTACAGAERSEARRRRALWLVWALARVAVALEGGSEAAVAAFEAALGGETPFVEKEPLPRDLQSTALARAEDSAARRLSVKGLAALARSSPAARAALERLAAGPRRRVRSWTGEAVADPATDPAFSLEIRELAGHERSLDMEEYDETACWARAAVQWLDHGRPR